MKKLKLPKFETVKLPVDEMNAIKAGSGICQTGTISCSSATGDADNYPTGDTDAD